MKISILIFLAVKPIQNLFTAIVLQTIGPYTSFDTHIAIFEYDKCQMPYALNMAFFGIFDINDTYGILHMSCLDMAIWVSKVAL